MAAAYASSKLPRLFFNSPLIKPSSEGGTEELTGELDYELACTPLEHIGLCAREKTSVSVAPGSVNRPIVTGHSDPPRADR